LELEAINEADASQRSICHGHPSILRLWWARRPLVACCANRQESDQAGVDFVIDLCTYPGPRDTTAEARRHILEAPARCLSAEWVGAGLAPAQTPTTVEDIEAGRRARV
jgi:hypothetical protein